METEASCPIHKAIFVKHCGASNHLLMNPLTSFILSTCIIAVFTTSVATILTASYQASDTRSSTILTQSNPQSLQKLLFHIFCISHISQLHIFPSFSPEPLPTNQFSVELKILFQSSIPRFTTTFLDFFPLKAILTNSITFSKLNHSVEPPHLHENVVAGAMKGVVKTIKCNEVCVSHNSTLGCTRVGGAVPRTIVAHTKMGGRKVLGIGQKRMSAVRYQL